MVLFYFDHKHIFQEFNNDQGNLRNYILIVEFNFFKQFFFKTSIVGG